MLKKSTPCKLTIVLLIIFWAAILITGCTTQTSGQASPDREVISQLSTLNSLMAGNYDRTDTAAFLKESGDLGLGTFEGLDGEMVMLDSKVYQAKADGSVVAVPDTIGIPFAAVTYFDRDIEKKLTALESLESLEAELDKLMEKKDAFYAIRVDGTFSYVLVRSVPKQEKPYPVLSEVTKNQPTFEYENIKGTLVGFWCPEYVGGINVPGYHLHFISDDRTKGGHLLELAMPEASAALDITRQFDMKLAEETANESQGAVSREEIEKVEQ